MPKLKTAKAKPQKKDARAAVPCLILILSGMLLVSLLFYSMLKSS
jgi:hypothetical protein